MDLKLWYPPQMISNFKYLFDNESTGIIKKHFIDVKTIRKAAIGILQVLDAMDFDAENTYSTVMF